MIQPATGKQTLIIVACGVYNMSSVVKHAIFIEPEVWNLSKSDLPGQEIFRLVCQIVDAFWQILIVLMWG